MKEKELSIALGISRDDLKHFREGTTFKENQDWQRIPSRKPEKLWEVRWTEVGIVMLKHILGLKITEPVEPPKTVTGKIYAKFNNRHIIQVMVDNQKYNAICKDNSKFLPNMDVDLKWDGSRWCVVRHPRFQGKY